NRLTRPYVGFSPIVPQSAEGTRIEPPVSLPNARGISSAASATAEPPLEPPEMRSSAHGLCVDPIRGLTEEIPQANPCVCVFPITPAPASRARATAVASRSGTCVENIGDP